MAQDEHVTFQHLELLDGIQILTARYVRQRFARHSHEEFTFGTVTAGAGAFEHRGAAELATPGRIVAINPEAVHTGHAASAGGWSQRMLYLRAPPLAALAGRGSVYFPAVLIDDSPLARGLVAMHRCLRSAASPLTRETALVEWLAALLNRHARPRPPAPTAGREPLAVTRARDYLHAHPEAPVSLVELAALVDLSPAHLVRVFRRSLGLPPHAYQALLRLRLARRLLASGADIAGAALAAGFADQPHLTRAFRRHYGLTPGAYRRAINIVQD